MKKLLFLMMVMLPMVVSAYDAYINGIYYNLGTTVAEVTYNQGQHYTGDIVIPEKITYIDTEYTVTGIGGYAFNYCSELTSVTIPNSVTYLGFQAFNGCSSLKSISLPPHLITIGDRAFYGCSNLTSIIIPNSVTTIGQSAFYCCPLTSIELGNGVTSIGDGAFSGSSTLTAVYITDLEAWCNITFEGPDSSPLHRAHHLFLNGNEITELVIPNGVTSIGDYAFYGGSSFTSVTIPSSVTSIGESAFLDCGSLTDVYCLAEDLPSTYGSFWYSYIHENVTLHVPAAAIEAYQSTKPWSDFKEIVAIESETEPEPYAVLSDDYSTLTFYYDKNKASRSGMDLGPIYYTYNSELDRNATTSGWDPHRESITTVVFDASFADCTTLTTTCYWFCGFENLTTITGFGNLKTSNIENMFGMFQDCSALTSLDLSHFDTSNVKDLCMMFSGCSKLASIDVGNWNTSNVMNMGHMFQNCSSLTSLDLGSWNTAKVTDMSYMFIDCSNLTSLDMSNWNTAKVMDMGSMFKGCSSLTSLDVSKFSTASVTRMGEMFSGCSGLTSLKVNHFDTSKVVLMNGLFYNCSGLTSLDVSHFDTSNVIDMCGMFCLCSNLTSLDVSNFNTANVTNMASMFSVCSKVSNLDVSHFNTANVTDMNNMFNCCFALTSLDVNSFNTANVTDMERMFFLCSKLSTIYCNNSWSCASSDDMFYLCYALKGAIDYVYEDFKVDVTYANPTTGYFTMIGAGGKCATPSITIDNGHLTFICETEGATCHYEIKRTGEGNSVALSATADYVVSVWATKAGYEKSETTTATITVKQGDVTGDGNVTITDAVAVVNIILNGGEASAPQLNLEDIESQAVPE